MTTEDIDDIDLILDDQELSEFVEIKKSKKYMVGDVDQSALEDNWEDYVPDMSANEKFGKSKCDKSI
ncbi:hypothetical protein RR48_08627 [Papilio machaon]|uniref:Uncharacterized protein n=1 Tax=Papilio machaon TaxID=76193 RepID=A0A194RN66_PAPMA|nr:hypothetical protein RR48_08627 [Papilio machaon]